MTDTKVYYYFEDNTPYVSTVPVPPDRITLGDFKKIFKCRGYKYYYQKFDDMIGREAKHEILNDQEKLVPNQDGRVVLHLRQLSTNGTLQKTTKPRATNGLGYRGQASSSICDDFDVGGGQRVSMVTADKSSVGSFISKRAGEQLADLCTSEEDAYRLDENSTTYTENSSDYRLVHDKSRGYGSKKNRYRRPFVPSTICSASESSYSLPVLTEVKLNLKDFPMGLSFVPLESGIFIGAIQPGSAGDRCQVLEVGDQVLQVENTSFEHLTNDQCLGVLKRAAAEKREVVITVAKRTTDRQSDTLSALCDTMGVDVSLWVEMTNQPGVDRINMVDINKFETQSIGGRSTSDEERAAYEDRRNGIGAHFVPMVMNSRQPHHHHPKDVHPPTHLLQQQNILLRNSNPQALGTENDEDSEKTFLTINDTPLIIVQFMARPTSGLMVKDRKWLKIPIPMSFIGHELVNWLMEKVHGFENRKQARAFANRLLELGLIKHAVNMSRFSEKCYYKFEDKISAERQRLEQQTKMNGDSPTEITYMSGPSSPRQKRATQQKIGQSDPTRPVVPLANHFIPMPHRSMGPPKQNGVSKTINLTEEMPSALNIWPISPIIGTRNSRTFPRDCDSPAMTNDYASMIQVDAIGQNMIMPATEHTMPRVGQMDRRQPAISTSTFLAPNSQLMMSNPMSGQTQHLSALQLQSHHVLPSVAPFSKLRSLSPPPPNTPNTVTEYAVP